jgi:dipeptidase
MCDTLVRVSPGRVLFAKNSDRDPNEAQFLEWHPRRAHTAGSALRCTWIEIPQAPVTHAVLLSRPFWMWGAEIAANEHGVVIGNEAVFTRQPYAATGLTGMDLVRLGVERAETASSAVEVITGLLETHGQGGGCGHEDRSFTYHNSFIVADSHGAFVLETAGRRWQAQRVAEAWSISNGLTLPEMISERDPLRSAVACCDPRRARTLAAAQRAQGVADLTAVLRAHEHPGSEPGYRLVNGGMSAPCMHAGGVVASSQTTASWVAELRPEGVQHWVTATSAPCLSLFKPVRVDSPLDLGPTPTDRADDRSLWWRHERLHRAVMQDPARLRPLFEDERDAVEARWLASPPEPASAFEQGDRLLAEWTARIESNVARDLRPWWVRRYWRTRSRLAGMR